MPRVPSYGGLQVTPSVEPTSSLSLVTPKTHEGVQEGLQGVQKAAQVGLAIQQEAFEEANRVRAQEALNAVQAEMQDVLYGEKGMMYRMGAGVNPNKDGQSFTDEGMGRFNESISVHSQGMNRWQKELFDESVQKLSRGYNETLIRHEATQMREYSLGVWGTKAKRATDAMAINGADPVAFDQSVTDVHNAYAEMGKIKGWGSDETKYNAEKAISDVTGELIRGMLVSGNLEGAYGLYEREKGKGRLKGDAILKLSKPMKAVSDSFKVAEIANQGSTALIQSRDVNRQIANVLLKNGYKTEDVIKGMEGKSKDEVVDALADRVQELLIITDGDVEKTMDLAWAEQGEYADATDKETSAKVSAKAKSLAGQVITAPEYRTQITEGDIAIWVQKHYPELANEEFGKVTKQIGENIKAEVTRTILEQKSDIQSFAKAIQEGASISTLDTSRLTTKQQKDLIFFSTNASRGKYDIGLAQRLMDQPALLSGMNDAEFEATLLRFDVNDQKALRNQRAIVLDPNNKAEEPKDADMRQIFNNIVNLQASHLNESDNSTRKRILYDEFVRICRNKQSDSGKTLSRPELEAVARSMVPVDAFGGHTQSMFNAEKALDSNPKARDAIKTWMTDAGWDASSPEAVLIFADRIMAGDKTILIPKLSVQNQFTSGGHFFNLLNEEVDEYCATHPNRKRNEVMAEILNDTHKLARLYISWTYDSNKMARASELNAEEQRNSFDNQLWGL